VKVLSVALPVVALAMGGFSPLLLAKAPPDQVAKLGKELTPVGAERAGNADGSLPAWTPMKQSGPLKDFWASNPAIDGEKPLFTISAANMAKYADKLTEGHKELLKRPRIALPPSRSRCSMRPSPMPALPSWTAWTSHPLPPSAFPSRSRNRARSRSGTTR
jgi:hypothetical protein